MMVIFRHKSLLQCVYLNKYLIQTKAEKFTFRSEELLVVKNSSTYVYLRKLPDSGKRLFTNFSNVLRFSGPGLKDGKFHLNFMRGWTLNSRQSVVQIEELKFNLPVAKH